jgi:hypothetical protein
MCGSHFGNSGRYFFYNGMTDYSFAIGYDCCAKLNYYNRFLHVAKIRRIQLQASSYTLQVIWIAWLQTLTIRANNSTQKP